MRFPEYFQNGGEPVISFELFPPKTAVGMRTLKNRVIPRLVALNPSYITVTYGAMGSTQGKTLEIASLVKNEFNQESACHLTCVGASRSEIEHTVKSIADSGVQNIVALRGDAPQGEDNFVPPEDGFGHANELVTHIRKIEDPQRPFGLAVAGYPEKHLEAENFDTDIANLKRKIESGGDIVITQLFYNNAAYFTFVEKVRQAGIDTPIVPGLMPIQSAGQIQRITSMCGATIPPELNAELNDASEDNERAVQIGIRKCIEQATELLEKSVPGIHFYVLNKEYQMEEVMKALPL